jgi:hypothetical protein
MVTYPCRTLIPSKADAFFIPYYGGLEALESLYGEKKHLRDTQGASLINWLKQNATEMWSRYIGADHFMVLGRSSWDFFRQNESSWGTKLLQQPELASVTALVLEKMPRKAAVQRSCALSHFLPSSFSCCSPRMDAQGRWVGVTGLLKTPQNSGHTTLVDPCCCCFDRQRFLVKFVCVCISQHLLSCTVAIICELPP